MKKIDNFFKCKQKLYSIISIIGILSCSQLSISEIEMRDAHNKTIEINEISNVVYSISDSLFINEVRLNFDYISIVYLRYGCAPCLSNFVRWISEMDKFGKQRNHTLLFIIRGQSYKEFMTDVEGLAIGDYQFHVMIDDRGLFCAKNKHVPQWILERSVLIDAENRVKLVGEPFATPEMTRLFYSIVNGDDKN